MKCLALRYLSLDRYEDPELARAHDIKLKILDGLSPDLVTSGNGYLHDGAVHIPAHQGVDGRMIWFDFMAVLEDTPGYATRIGTETMDSWFCVSPPAFYIICFPKAPRYVAIIPHHIAWKDRKYWGSVVSIPGPYFPYLLGVEQVHEALRRISGIEQGSVYKNPGTEIVLHRWLPTSFPAQDLPELDILQVNVTSCVPSRNVHYSQVAGRKRGRETSVESEMSMLPPPLKTAFRSDNQLNSKETRKVDQVVVATSTDPQDDLWSQWLETEWMDSQRWLTDYNHHTTPAPPQEISTAVEQADVMLAGQQDISPSLASWDAEVLATVPAPATQAGSTAVFELRGNDQTSPWTTDHAADPTDITHDDLTADWSPLSALPWEQQPTLPNTSSPTTVAYGMALIRSPVPVSIAPSGEVSPQPRGRNTPRRLLELYNMHPWGNHVYLSEPAPLTPSLLLPSATSCLLLLTSYMEAQPGTTPMPLQNLQTAHPCLHIISSVADPESFRLIPSRDVDAYICHLRALKQGTVNTSGSKGNARCGLRGKNKRKTESPCVGDVIEWVGAKSLRAEDLEKELGNRYATEVRREKPRGAEDGEKWKAIASIGEVLQAQVDWITGEC